MTSLKFQMLRQPCGEVRVASCVQEIVSVASQGICFTYISCVPSCHPQTWRDAFRG